MHSDNEIIRLLFERNEEGLRALEEKYGGTCAAISKNILSSPRDAEESINDAYLQIWNTIPPKNPACLPAYLYTLVRHCACVCYHKNKAAKRNSYYDTALEELEDCIPCGQTPHEALEKQELSRALNDFLATLKEEDRKLFVLRYWSAQSVAQLSKERGKSAHYISVRLDRIRKKLKNYLLERGITV
ncbi:MAG: sigma-70 family RNA polymerase sigma factor [Clostridia bacterium]|nr:sigma-70 family RNA polymerase sigma factor [Clostridia bacterium]